MSRLHFENLEHLIAWLRGVRTALGFGSDERGRLFLRGVDELERRLDAFTAERDAVRAWMGRAGGTVRRPEDCPDWRAFEAARLDLASALVQILGPECDQFLARTTFH